MSRFGLVSKDILISTRPSIRALYQSRHKTTHFGYQDVSEEEKSEKVREVFASVAAKYDLMNDLMSGGVHRLWKDYFVKQVAPVPQAKLLDVAGGTGDISFRYIQRLLYQQPQHKESESHPSKQVTICDFSESMLAEGRKRAKKLGYTGISWVCGDAQQLPFPEHCFDCYTIAYGIRNVVHVQKALNEAYRVLKPGGRFMCLEFSQVPNPVLRWFYDQYSFNVIPPVGHVVTGDWHSYQYLVESIRKFPDQKTFALMIEDAGFRRVRYEDLTFGITAIHSGYKL
ncbi:ubiquinone/menaquinone biosynthesis C-methyltransferase UbiE isoform X1 [Hyalella azteca]|uniref:2-methoxy-6-polyprenyl-1,4-benzoquinol methylase, mitochondrial n=1 Tax=Hyalella azteca TaxID=294128 RepID=A0A8B7NU38_HYAAZ|nr:ubiquinone/menaquinone biosynthesis C-methyltransferase UbiE isoform X1 [Hyalella azteca]